MPVSEKRPYHLSNKPDIFLVYHRVSLFLEANFFFRAQNLPMKPQLLLLLTAMLICGNAFSQFSESDASLQKLNHFYLDEIGSSADIYSGAVYVEQAYRKRGTPFFASDTLSNGWIVYNGQLYPDLKLQWDVLQNYVLTKSLVGYSKLILRNDLIDSFFFAGHLIRYMPANKEQNLMNSGFYDILYRGATPLIASRKKDNIQTIEAMTVYYRFDDKSKYYIQKDSIYYRVANKRDVLKLFPARASGIKRQVRRAGINWRKEFEQALTIAVTYIDNPNRAK